MPSEYAIGVSPLGEKESTAASIVASSSGPIGSTSLESVQAAGFSDWGSVTSEPYTRRPTWVPAGSEAATDFSALFAAANFVPPEEISSPIEPEVSSSSRTFVASSAEAGAAARTPVPTSSRATRPRTRRRA